MTNINKKIIIIGGDPYSINSEIIFKSWKKLKKTTKKKIYVIANYSLIKKQFNELNYKIKIIKIKNINEISKGNELKIINVDLKFTNPFKVKREDASQYVIDCLNLAHKLALRKNISGMINCAINKDLLITKKIGVTEFLASKCNIKDNSEVMLISNQKFSVCPITTHIDLKDVSRNIKSKKIINKVKTIQKWFLHLLNKNPKIGILGLNPHNAELRTNSEENNEIIPAIKKLKKIGINIKGPLVSDTIFVNDFKNYDVIVGMFHDQVLTPFKAIFKFNAINITLGLKYLRVSPDHGTATNLIKQNKADFSSLIQCINFVDKFK